MKMKRFFALMLALVLSLTMLQGVAFADVGDEFRETTGQDANGQPVNIGAEMTFKVLSESGNTGTVQVGGDNQFNSNTFARAIAQDTTGALNIPATVTHGSNTYTVTAIGAQAFYGCTDLTSVTLPDSVTTIGNHAFYGCTSLTSVTLPDSLTTIGGNTFSGCTSLTSVTLPDSLTTIGGNTFSGCTSLTSITLPDSVHTIFGSAFDGCTSLTSITIPAGVTEIAGNAFYGSAIKTITFEGSSIATLQSSISPGGVPIVYSAFNGADKLTTINLAGDFNQAMVDELAKALALAANPEDPTATPLTLSNLTINYNQSWTDEQVNKLIEEMEKITGLDANNKINTDNINPYTPPITPTGGSGSTGSAGAGAWYIGTLNGADGQPTYTQIIDTADTTAMLQAGSTITVTGQSPTGVIVKLDPTALRGKQSLSINSSIADMQLTAEQIASLIQQAGGNTIHITIKQTPDGSTISILAGGRTITL